jgi:hypothetical protein
MNARLISLALAAAALLAIGCSKETKEAAPPSSEPPATAAAPEPIEPSKGADLEPVFAEYEAIRALLAADQDEGVAKRAAALKRAAAAAADAVNEPARPHLTAVAIAADKLAASDTSDLAATRRIFGEVSKSLVALRGSDEELAARYHVFECPMAKGYKRWVQPTDELENPYMGQEMLTCGSEVTGD